MANPPIPQRIPPLKWRAPSLLWTPLALALAIGAPALIFYPNDTLMRFVLAAGAAVFALALISLGASWALGRAPRTRRTVVLHVLLAIVLTALAGPFVLGAFLPDVSMAMTPFALVFGLPAGLISATLFSAVALSRTPPPSALLEEGLSRPHDVQPFR